MGNFGGLISSLILCFSDIFTYIQNNTDFFFSNDNIFDPTILSRLLFLKKSGFFFHRRAIFEDFPPFCVSSIFDLTPSLLQKKINR